MVSGVKVLFVGEGLPGLKPSDIQQGQDSVVVHTETAVSAGLDRLRDEDFDCIVSTYQLADENGVAFLKTVREDYPRIPFILVTDEQSGKIASEALAAGATDYVHYHGETDGATALSERIEDAVEQHRIRRQAETRKRITSVIRDINRALIRAEFAGDVEQAVCDILSDAEPYLTACIADVDPDTMRIEPRTWSGADRGYFENLDMVISEGNPGRRAPGGRAYHDREIAISQNIADDAEYEKWRPEATERGFQALAVVPLEYEGDLYGLLAVFADRPHAFDDTEQELLAEVGDNIAHALHTHQLQSTLERATSRLEALFEQSPDMINVHDMDGNLIEPNRQLCERTGYDEAELTSMKIWELDREIERGEAEQLWNRLDEGEAHRLEGEYQRKDGSTFPVEVRLRRFELEDDTRFIAISRDITERKQRKQELERYERLIESLPVGVFRTTVGGEFVDLNRQFVSIFGGSSDASFEDRRANELYVDDEDRVALLSELEEAGVVENETLLMQTLDGDQRWIKTTLRLAEEGGQQYLDGIVQDVTEQREYERRLEEAETLFEHAQDGLFLVDVDDGVRFQRVNPAFEELTGLSTEEVRGEPPFAFVDDDSDNADLVKTQYQQCIQQQAPVEHEARLSVGGEQTHWATRLAPVIIDGDVEKIVGSTRDITERKQRERELRRNERRFEAMFNDPNILVGLLDLDGSVIDINDTAMAYIEEDFETIAGRPFPQTPWFSGSDTVQQEVREMIDRAATGEYVDFELDLSKSVGEPLVVSGVFRPVTDESGEVVSLLISDRDVTERKQRERELELRNRAIEEAPLGISMADADRPDNPLIYVNDAFEQITGYSADDMLGENCRKLQGKETAASPVSEMRTAIDEAEPVTVELRNYRKDGELFWNRVSIAPVTDDDGTVTNYVGFQADITERKQRQQEVRRNERRFEAMFNDPHILVGLLETDGTVLDVNETAMEYIDADLADVRGTAFWDTPWWEERLKPVIKEKVTQAASGEYVTYEADLTYPDGDPYSVVGVIRPVQNDDGDVVSMIVSARDITERKQRAKELAESEARYQSLTEDVLDTSEVGTFILGPDFDVVWVNQAVEEYFGLDRDEIRERDKPTLVRNRVAEIFEASDEVADQLLSTYEDNAGVVEFECHVLPAENRAERWLKHWSQPIESGLYEGGRIEHYTDITARKKRDQQLDVMDRVLRHNLHNEMAIVLGAAETISNRVGPEIERFAEMILNSGQDLLEITKKQRDIVEVVSEDPDVTTIDLADVLQSTVNRYASEYPNAEITLDSPDDVRVRAIPQFSRAVSELIENAVVHGDSETPTVDVQVEATPGSVQIRVADTGPQIPAAERAILQGEGERSPLYHGSGMGLWLVNWIVSTSNGQVSWQARTPTGNIVLVELQPEDGERQ